MTLSQQLTMIVGNRMFENEPMFKHTNFRIGGPAKWFVEIKSLDELQGVLEVIKENQLSFFVLGGGSNILVSDQGFDGVVVKMAMRTYEIQGKRIKSDAGVLASALARATATHGLKGLTWAISLPGTVGGGVRGNAGCFGGEMKDYFISAFVLRDGELIELKKEDLAFGYRESVIKHNNDIIVSATFELQEGDPTELEIELDDKLMRRKKSQPLDAGSAGCLFKNYEIKNDEDVQRLASYADIPPEMWSARRISAGWLIDNLGLK